MHDFAVLFDFDSCVTDVSSRLERARRAFFFPCASPSASSAILSGRGLPDKTRLTRYKSKLLRTDAG